MLKATIEPRLYQQTIFGSASLKNTLVVIPTGMGKTLIAELLTSHRLQHYPKEKVLILAPTRPLIKQHQLSFLKDMELEEEQTALFTGNVKPEKRAQLWKEAQVIFSTPQGLENDILNSSIKLEEVSLLVIDEAHRAVGDYAYVFIADQYSKRAKNPRILGLTASPGSKKESIEEVCKNLSIEEIEFRSNESPDVQPYIQEVDIEHVSVQMPEEFKKLHKTLQQHRDEIVTNTKKLGVIQNYAFVNKSNILQAQAKLHAQAAKGRKDFDVLKSMSLLAELLKIEHAIELIETQGVQAVDTYLKKLQQEANRGQSKAVQNLVKNVRYKTATLLVEQLKAAEIEHPKLRVIKKLALKETYADKEVKLIIFTQYRDQAVAVHESLNSIGITSKIFVGQMKKGTTGMSQKEQEQMLDEFRNGEFSCLIATSVAEEGIDIPSVNLVIFYEPIPSAIRTVQRRGRTGRLEKGRVIMLITENTRDSAYKWAAHHKEKRMYRVLDQVKRDFKRRDAPIKKEPTLQHFTEKIPIVVDHREKASGVLKALVDMNAELRLEQLQVGDYLLSDRVVVEYKRIPDFVDSIIDGRLLSQLRELRRYQRPLIILEGEEDLYSVRRMHQNSLLGMLATITISYNIPVLFTKNARETAALLLVIAKKEREKGSSTFQQHALKPMNDLQLQEFIVASLPGVGNQLAKDLLHHFRNITNITTASIEELANVPKIGKKKAEQIYNILRKEYDPSK